MTRLLSLAALLGFTSALHRGATKCNPYEPKCPEEGMICVDFWIDMIGHSTEHWCVGMNWVKKHNNSVEKGEYAVPQHACIVNSFGNYDDEVLKMKWCDTEYIKKDEI